MRKVFASFLTTLHEVIRRCQGEVVDSNKGPAVRDALAPSSFSVVSSPPSLNYTGKGLISRLQRCEARARGRVGNNAQGSVSPLVDFLQDLEADGFAAVTDLASSEKNPSADSSAFLLWPLLKSLSYGGAAPPLYAEHALTYSFQSVERIERLIANVIAAERLRLPGRFLWPSGDVSAASARSFLWAPTVRDGSGTLRVLAAPTTSPREGFVTPFSSIARAHGPSVEERAGGGGMLCRGTLESYLVLLHTARTRALSRDGHFHSSARPGSSGDRLVIYASDQVDPRLLTAAGLLGLREVRLLQTVLHPTRRNYVVDVDAVKRRVLEDRAGGLDPFLIVGVLGGALSGAVDPLPALAAFCARAGLWFHLDASHGAAALIADAPRPRSPPRPGSSFSLSSTSAEEAEGAAMRAGFCEAAASADSIYVGGERGGLPFSPFACPAVGEALASSPPSGSLLYFANTAQVGRALREAEKRTSPHNGVLSTALDAGEGPLWASSMLCLPPLEVISLGYGLAFDGKDAREGGAADLPRRVRRQQRLLAHLQRSILADGRFDAPLRSAFFGVVLFRWLLQDDEATRRLAEAWRRVLVEGVSKGLQSGSGEPAPVRVYLSLVVLQKRVWLRIQLSEPAWEAEGEGQVRGSEKEEGGDVVEDLDASARRAEAYVMSTLQEAVDQMDEVRFDGLAAGE